jgi:hypothetical protein
MAPVSAMLVPLATRETETPAQVVVPFPAAVNDAGNVSIKSDCVSANAFELFKVMVRVDATAGPTVVGAKDSVTVGATGLNETAVEQVLVPAVEAAVVVALVEPTVMVATSVPPCESVTVSVSVPVPVTATWALLAPEVILRPPLATQAYV